MRKCTLVLLLLLGVLGITGLSAQCSLPGTSFGGTSAPTVGGTTSSITTCNFAGEYSPLSAVVSGESYIIRFTGGASNFITIFDAGGTAVAFGADSVAFTAASSGTFNIAIHLNDGNCSTDSQCHAGTVECTSCSAAVPGCMDPAATNYNPAATVDDGSCIYPAPANDDCAGAIALNVNGDGTCTMTTISSNFGATHTATPTVDASCPGSTPDPLDIWFSAVVPMNGIIDFSFEDIPGVTSVVALYTGTCGSLTFVASSCSNATTRTFSGLAAGTVVYFRVWDFGSNDTGDMEICASTPPPCPAPAGLGTVNVTSFSADLNWVAGATATDFLIEYMLAGTAPGNGVVVSGVIGTDGPAYVLTGLSTNTNYDFYIRELCSNGDTSALAGPETFTTKGPAPLNDTCGGAMMLMLGAGDCDSSFIASVDNANTTKGLTANDPGCASYSSGTLGEVWYQVTVPASGAIVVETSADGSSTVTDGGMAIYEGTCSGLTLVECDDDDGPGNFSRVELTGRTPNEVLYVAVWEYANNTIGTYNICVWDAQPPLACGLNSLTVTTDCTSDTTFQLVVTFNGTASDYVIADDDANTMDMTGLSASTVNYGAYANNAAVTITVYSASDSANCNLVDVGAPQSVDCTPPPANDECANAVALTLGNGTCTAGYTTGSNVAATTSATPFGGTCGGTTKGGDIWYSVAIPASGAVTVARGNTDFSTAVMEYYVGACGTLTYVDCFAYFGSTVPTEDALTGLDTLGATTLYIRVWDFSNNDFGDVELCVYEPFACSAPNPASATNLTQISADITWGSNGTNQVGYTVEYGPTGFTQGSGTTVTSATNPVMLTGLMSETTYEFYIQDDCGTDGLSVWVGPFDFTTLGPPPANDDCTGAIALMTGQGACAMQTVVVNANSTQTLNSNAPTCGFYNAGNGSFGEVWYSVVIPASGEVVIECSADTSGTITDNAMTAYSGACSALTLIECDDDDGPGSFARLDLSGRSPGETIYVAAYEYGNNLSGSFNICAWDPQACTVAPNTPVNVNVTGVERRRATISWDADVLDVLRYKVEYRVQGTMLWWPRYTDQLSTTLVGLRTNTTYEYQVRAECDMFMSAYSPIGTFTTTGSAPSPWWVYVSGTTMLPKENGITNSLKVYPNPITTDNALLVDYSIAPNTMATIQIVDVLGQVVKVAEIQGGTNKLQVDISDLQAGSYFIELSTEKDKLTKRFIVIE